MTLFSLSRAFCSGIRVPFRQQGKHPVKWVVSEKNDVQTGQTSPNKLAWNTQKQTPAAFWNRIPPVVCGLAPCKRQLDMGQEPNRIFSEHPNPTTKIGPKIGEFTYPPKWI